MTGDKRELGDELSLVDVRLGHQRYGRDRGQNTHIGTADTANVN